MCQPSKVECYPVRLKPGDELVGSLLKFVKESGLQAAFIMTCCGSVTRATLRYAEHDGKTPLRVEAIERHFEILSLVGTLSADGGHHLHISLGDKDGRVIGGHVVENLPIFTTAEIVLGELKDLQFNREMDNDTGYRELVIQKRK